MPRHSGAHAPSGWPQATLPAIHQAQLVIGCRTHRAIGADHPLKAGDVVNIFAKA